MTEPKFSIKAIRECAAAYVRDMEKHKQTPSALIRWTIPGLCDEVERLRREVSLRGEVAREKQARAQAVEAVVRDVEAWKVKASTHMHVGTECFTCKSFDELTVILARSRAPQVPAEQDDTYDPDWETSPILRPAPSVRLNIPVPSEWCAAHNAIWPLAESRCAAADPWEDASPCERRATSTDAEVQ